MPGPNVIATAPTRRRLDLKQLVGSGDRIALFALPFVIVGFVVQIALPSLLAVDAFRATGARGRDVPVGGRRPGVGVVRRPDPVAGAEGRLITTGPYAVVKHPLYTSVALLVLPALGVLLGTWLGVAIGVAVYVGSRLFAPAEEAELHETFGPEWETYARSVKLPWL